MADHQEMLNILRNGIDHPSIEKFHLKDKEVDVLDNINEEEKSEDAIYNFEVDFDIISYFTKSSSIMKKIGVICSQIKNENETIKYALSPKKLNKWLERKFELLCKAVTIDEEGLHGEINKATKIKASEIFFSEIPSQIIAFSFLVNTLELEGNNALKRLIFPPPAKKQSIYKGSKADMKKDGFITRNTTGKKTTNQRSIGSFFSKSSKKKD